MNRIRYIVREVNGGLSAARNTGIKATEADLIALLDSDDIWEPECLQNQVTHLLQHPELDLVYGDSVFMGGELSGKRFMELFPSQGDVTFESFVRRQCSVMISVTAKRDLLIKAGLFNENLRRCEDFDLWGRLLKAGGRIGYHRHLLMKYRRHDQSLSANELAMYQTIVGVYKSFLLLDLTKSERTAVESQIKAGEYDILFWEGRQAFIQGDFAQSVLKLNAANHLVPKTRLAFITKAIEICPRALHWAYLRLRPA